LEFAAKGPEHLVPEIPFFAHPAGSQTAHGFGKMPAIFKDPRRSVKSPVIDIGNRIGQLIGEIIQGAQIRANRVLAYVKDQGIQHQMRRRLTNF
jgi:hypothetical protein